MLTADQHRAEANRLLAEATAAVAGRPSHVSGLLRAQNTILLAQVHATLAAGGERGGNDGESSV